MFQTGYFGEVFSVLSELAKAPPFWMSPNLNRSLFCVSVLREAAGINSVNVFSRYGTGGHFLIKKRR